MTLTKVREAEQWKAEAALRSLDDPVPIPARWKLTERDDIVYRSISLVNGGVRMACSPELPSVCSPWPLPSGATGRPA